MERAENITTTTAGPRRSRFSLLFVGIVLTLAVRPFLEGSVGVRLLFGIFFSFIVLACVYSVSKTRRTFWAALVLGFPAVGSVWLGVLLEKEEGWQIAGGLFQIVFWSYILVVILSHLLQAREVTADTITGAACAYFLIGLAWSYVYFVLESFSPGSFTFAREDESAVLNIFIYFSFITLATVGYGDVTPVSSPARSLVVLEAVLGQLFVAITISMLVGSYLSRSRKGASAD
ncbi:MAG TPA: potassium channel family protein [Thermodesulfobacteriota bacterium]|nr:potassium channel family protein [Thermodesulfobacteriota bacterium]